MSECLGVPGAHELVLAINDLGIEFLLALRLEGMRQHAQLIEYYAQGPYIARLRWLCVFRELFRCKVALEILINLG